MRKHQYSAVALAALVVLSVVALPGAMATDGDASNDDLEIDVAQNDAVVVDVTQNGSTVDNGTLDVMPVDEANDSYVDAGVYDIDGELELAVPNETVEVSFEATVGNESTETTETLEADEDELAIDVEQDGDDVVTTVTDAESGVENATLDVTAADENESYADAGEYATDENGTVTLSAPAETVDVTFNATVDDASAETTVTLEPAEDDNFGSLVSLFIGQNKGDVDGPFGLAVAEFVLDNNPGNAPDHAGPPGDGEQGPPEHANSSSDDTDGGDDDENGPPDHANSD